MNARSLGLLGTCALLLGACASAPAPQPDVFFRLELPPVPARRALATRVVVEPFDAPGIYSERPLLWARGPALQQYYRHFWAEMPGLELQQALVDALRRAGASAVLTPADRVAGDLYVRSRIRRLELQTVGARRAILQLEFTIADVRNQPLRRVEFRRERELGDIEPQAYVAAISALAGEAFADVAQVLWSLPAPAVTAAQARPGRSRPPQPQP